MGGLVKGVKKVFKAVGGFIKRYWKVVVIAAAVYFTAGIALAYFAPTAGFAAAMPGFAAGGVFSSAATAIGIGDAASVAAGTGLFPAAFAAGAGTVAGAAAGTTALAGAAEAGGTAAAGTAEAAAPFAGLGGAETGTAALTDWGAAAGAGGASGAADLGGAGVLAAGTDQATIDAAAAGQLGGNAAANSAAVANTNTYGPPTTNQPMANMGPPEAADKGFWGGMSSGEKAMFAATAFKGIAGLLQPGPTRAQQGLWPGGAYFGMDEKGNGIDLGAQYKNQMTGSNDTTDLSAEASAPAPGAAPAQTAPLAAGGEQAQQQAQAQPQQPSPAASAQTGSAFLPTAGTGAATAQQTTAAQTDTLQKSGQANASFIQDTMDRLDPRKRNANAS